jgi:DNA-directed RNA polymerase specialized sigma24 family protein
MSNIQFIQVSPTELATLINEGLKNHIEQVLNELSSNQSKGKEYMSREETADFFGVSLVTIHSWTNSKILKHYKVGNRTYYKRAELVQVLENSNSAA